MSWTSRAAVLAMVLVGPHSAAGSGPVAAPDQGGPTELAERAGPVIQGRSMVSFAGVTLDGRDFALSRFLRLEMPKAVVISLFGTWCDTCASRLPSVGKVAEGRRARGLALVLVDVNEPEAGPEVGGWLRDHGVDVGALGASVVLDPFGKISERLGASTLPRTFVVGADGSVRAVFVREGDDFEALLAREVDAALRTASAPVQLSQGQGKGASPGPEANEVSAR